MADLLSAAGVLETVSAATFGFSLSGWGDAGVTVNLGGINAAKGFGGDTPNCLTWSAGLACAGGVTTEAAFAGGLGGGELSGGGTVTIPSLGAPSSGFLAGGGVTTVCIGVLGGVVTDDLGAAEVGTLGLEAAFVTAALVCSTAFGAAFDGGFDCSADFTWLLLVAAACLASAGWSPVTAFVGFGGETTAG